MKILVKFCHENNIYDKVYYNTKKCEWGNDPMKNVWVSHLNDIIQGSLGADMFFTYAFAWEKTNEGSIFWERIANKWKDYCKLNKISRFK